MKTGVSMTGTGGGMKGEPRLLPTDLTDSAGGPGFARDDVKERVRDATDIVDLIGSYISLRRAGKALVGLCPWHEDSRPSFQVNPERQTFRCWVCNLGGDAFSFLMKMEKLEFREALQQLAERAGIELSRSRLGLPADDKAGLLKASAWAADRYADCLRRAPEAQAARDYLHSRGLTEATIERFQLGYAPAGWDWLLRQAASAGIPVDHLVRTGLAVERQERSGHYDRFRDRVMFPIRDPQARCVAFGGRVLPGSTDMAKYINSPETPLFSKSSMLYGLDSAREAMGRSGRAIVVEGYTDCLAARQAGCNEVVAVLGTALGERHAKLLRRYADTIIVVLDGDDAGRRRADEILDVLLAEPIDVRIVRLPAGVDPCEFVVERGAAAFEELLAAAGDPLEYRMDEALAKLAGRPGDDAALAAVDSILGALARISPRSPLSQTQRLLREDQITSRLSRRFGMSREALRARMLELRGRFDNAAGRSSDTRDEKMDPVPLDGGVRLQAWDREVLEILVGVPEGALLIVREIDPGQLQSSASRIVLEAARRLHAAGRVVNLQELLLELSDPALQSLLVAVDTRITNRTPTAVAERVQHLEDALRRRTAERESVAHIAHLKTSRLDPLSEAAILEQLVVQRRAVQGMTEPKDG